MRAFFLTSGGYGDGFTLRGLAVKQEGGLAQAGLQVEGAQGRGDVFGYDQLEPPQSSAGGGVMDVDVRYSTADDEGIHAPDAQAMVQVRPVEDVVADLADNQLALLRL